MKTRVRIFGLLIVLLALLAACGGEEAAMDEARGDFGGESMAAEAPMEAEEGMDFGDVDDGTVTQTQLPAQERLIIRTGRISIVVEDTEMAMDDIVALAEAYGGWVVNSSLNQRGINVFGDVTFRVPAQQFETALADLRAMATDVTSESTSGEDVTEEFVDLEARLGNLEATAERVRAFLDEADDVEDALAVNQELSRLESEIERIKGRMQFLSQSAAFSTITVSLTPNAANQPIEVGGWEPQGVAKDAIEALLGALQVLADAAIWIALFVLPVALVIFLPLVLVIFLARRWWRRRRSSSRTEAPASAE
jgi:hypothetical protein